MVLPIIKEVKNLINFAKTSFKSKGGFRHLQGYISGIIGLGKKTVKKISEQIVGEYNQSSMNRILSEETFDKERLEERYLKKIKYLFKYSKIFLIFDDTIVERNGKHIERVQYHHDHSQDKDVKGHQYFTAILYTPLLQLPIFPKLYYNGSRTKIEMAEDLVDKIKENSIKVDTVLFDSWYSDADIINKCKNVLKARVICGIKTNRNIRFRRSNKKRKLSFITDRIPLEDKYNLEIDQEDYRISSYKVHLTKLFNLKLLISEKYNEDEKTWNKIHLISTNQNDTPEEIILIYKIRWCIETYHRDIKQNLGFATAYFRKESGIVSHTIFVAISYAILKLYISRKGINMTIGECCEHLRDKNINNVIREIVKIDDESARNRRFEEVFIN